MFFCFISSLLFLNLCLSTTPRCQTLPTTPEFGPCPIMFTFLTRLHFTARIKFRVTGEGRCCLDHTVITKMSSPALFLVPLGKKGGKLIHRSRVSVFIPEFNLFFFLAFGTFLCKDEMHVCLFLHTDDTTGSFLDMFRLM